MFNRIRIRFIMIASIAIFIILSSIVGIINTARCYQSQQEINRILHLISSNKGKLPGTTESSKRLGTKLSEDCLLYTSIDHWEYASFCSIYLANQSANSNHYPVSRFITVC